MNVFPGRLVDSVNGLIGRVKLRLLNSVTLIGSRLSFFDQDGEELDGVTITSDNVEGLDEQLGELKTSVRVIQVPEYKLITYDQNGLSSYLNTVGFTKAKQETIIFHVVEFLDPVNTILIPENNSLQDSTITVGFELNIDRISFESLTANGSTITTKFLIN